MSNVQVFNNENKQFRFDERVIIRYKRLNSNNRNGTGTFKIVVERFEISPEGIF